VGIGEVQLLPQLPDHPVSLIVRHALVYFPLQTLKAAVIHLRFRQMPRGIVVANLNAAVCLKVPTVL
jgi:hypothetical protein